MGWTRIGGCTSDIDCTDTNCRGSNAVPAIRSSLVSGRHIHLSGSFTLFTQKKLKSTLKRLGASEVKTGEYLQEATILIKGTSCKTTLLKQAGERNNILVLTEVELINRLHLEGLAPACASARPTDCLRGYLWA